MELSCSKGQTLEGHEPKEEGKKQRRARIEHYYSLGRTSLILALSSVLLHRPEWANHAAFEAFASAAEWGDSYRIYA